jgi:hypothetical protein
MLKLSVILVWFITSSFSFWFIYYICLYPIGIPINHSINPYCVDIVRIKYHVLKYVLFLKKPRVFNDQLL